METNVTTKPLSTTDRIAALEAQVSALESHVTDLIAKVLVLESKTAPKQVETKEMTDDHARRIMTGDLKDKKHKDAAEALGLTYGQVYSCRLGFTFKHIHKEMKAKGEANAWIK